MTTTIIKSKRGIFGKLVVLLNWAFHALMVYMIFINADATTSQMNECEGNSACEAGTAIGSGIVATIGWLIWMLGTLIGGILLWATRGKMVAVTKNK